MKKIIYTMALLAAVTTLNAQGILGKLKNKLTSGASKDVQSQVINQAGGPGSSKAPDGSMVKYTDPATVGTILMSYTQAELGNHPDGFDMWFLSVQVVNNQIVAKIAESNTVVYSYSGGQLQKTGETPPNINRNTLKNGSEIELFSKDFTQTDMGNAMLKNGHNVTSGMIPGKAEQTFTFNGKVVGRFTMAQIAHNADSTVVAVAGMSVTGGMSYHLNPSNGAQITLPKGYGALPLISPDGKITAALFGVDKKVIVSTGATYTINDPSNNQIWLRNTGNVFYIPSIGNSLVMERNGTLFYKFNNPVDLKRVFLNANETGMAWEGYRGLYFSDGTIFENASAPTKVVLDNKEVIVFLDVDTNNGNLYLCKHDL
ncbi:MAG: hypothetical protein JWR09_3564 [Mucilaginibacter sp.]|nr:hypothetical protein [Mucilaginibacter sp.]